MKIKKYIYSSHKRNPLEELIRVDVIGMKTNKTTTIGSMVAIAGILAAVLVTGYKLNPKSICSISFWLFSYY
jgi:hypothetical protein